MTRKLGIGAITKGSNNWTPRTSTAWQRERASGPLLPLEQPKGWLARIVGR